MSLDTCNINKFYLSQNGVMIVTSVIIIARTIEKAKAMAIRRVMTTKEATTTTTKDKLRGEEDTKGKITSTMLSVNNPVVAPACAH